jgi:hypothetical protein
MTVSELLHFSPFSTPQPAVLLAEMNNLTSYHLLACSRYRNIVGPFTAAESMAELPYLHVGVFKHELLFSDPCEVGIGRVLRSSATSGSRYSQIVLDSKGSSLQQLSVKAIIMDYVGQMNGPLLMLERPSTLRLGHVPARVAAGLGLRSVCLDLRLILEEKCDSVHWGKVMAAANEFPVSDLVVYGFTWLLWKSWFGTACPEPVRDVLRKRRVFFIHSGGWKKLEGEHVARADLDRALLACVGEGSKVVDFYGLVEQVGVIYPMCEYGFRHVPVWADALVRDPVSHVLVEAGKGQLQLLNTLAWGGPYHNVLTEDLAELVVGDCPCGRVGKRFVLHGRMPRVEMRGCANV